MAGFDSYCLSICEFWWPIKWKLQARFRWLTGRDLFKGVETLVSPGVGRMNLSLPSINILVWFLRESTSTHSTSNQVESITIKSGRLQLDSLASSWMDPRASHNNNCEIMRMKSILIVKTFQWLKQLCKVLEIKWLFRQRTFTNYQRVTDWLTGCSALGHRIHLIVHNRNAINVVALIDQSAQASSLLPFQLPS